MRSFGDRMMSAVRSAADVVGMSIHLIDGDYMVHSTSEPEYILSSGEETPAVHLIDFFPATLSRGAVMAIMSSRRHGVSAGWYGLGACRVWICSVKVGDEEFIVSMMPECIFRMLFAGMH